MFKYSTWKQCTRNRTIIARSRWLVPALSCTASTLLQKAAKTSGRFSKGSHVMTTDTSTSVLVLLYW